MTDRIEVTRLIAAPPAEIFAVLTDPQGHVAIDSSGMLQGAEGDRVTSSGDTFVVHMDRESLGDIPDYGTYVVTVTIRDFEPDALISWTILGRVRPAMGHYYGYRLQAASDPDAGTLVTSFYDWSEITPEWRDSGVFPVLGAGALSGTLGILDRTVRRGYTRGR